MSANVKLQSFLLTVILILTTMFSASFVKTKAASEIPAFVYGTDVKIRSSTSTANDNNLIEKVSYIPITILSSTKDSGGNVWYKVSYLSGGKATTGFVFYDSSYILKYTTDKAFEKKIAAFPESYQNSLRSLHAAYPNWEFIADEVSTSFSDAVAEQMTNNRKLVHMTSQPKSWRSMGLGAYDWNTGEWATTEGSWTGASREIIAYYMDPRNFLDSSYIYMFLEQSYNSSVQNKAGVKKIISGTFLEDNYTPATDETGNGSYLTVIMTAAKNSGVSPYIIASKIVQEQGSAGSSPLISGTYSGYEGYYNFFNVNATGSTKAEIYKNGLTYAKTKVWNTRYLSILGGANFLANDFISVGQDTYYYQDFNVHNGGSHQYAQAVHDAYNKGSSLAKTYRTDTDFALSFRIPVFKNMPDKVSAKPASSDKTNNYYLSALSVSGLTPSFSKYTYGYALKVTGDTAVKVKAVKNATITSSSSVKLKKGDNKVTITVKSETGYINSYVISVNASKACTLYLNSSGKIPDSSSSSSSSSSSASDVMLGDPSGDGKISIVDLAKVQMHILKVKTLSGDSLTAADVNKDGKVSIIDLAKIQMHILKVKIIEQ